MLIWGGLICVFGLSELRVIVSGGPEYCRCFSGDFRGQDAAFGVEVRCFDSVVWVSSIIITTKVHTMCFVGCGFSDTSS